MGQEVGGKRLGDGVEHEPVTNPPTHLHRRICALVQVAPPDQTASFHRKSWSRLCSPAPSPPSFQNTADRRDFAGNNVFVYFAFTRPFGESMATSNHADGVDWRLVIDSFIAELPLHDFSGPGGTLGRQRLYNNTTICAAAGSKGWRYRSFWQPGAVLTLTAVPTQLYWFCKRVVSEPHFDSK